MGFANVLMLCFDPSHMYMQVLRPGRASAKEQQRSWTLMRRHEVTTKT